MGPFLWVCLGGAAGSGARFAVSRWAIRALGAGFPYGTVIVNLVGSFLLGAIMYLALHTALLPPRIQLLLATGVMGGFTTYSSFSFETMALAQRGSWASAGLNVAVTLVGGLLACLLGFAAARALS